LGSKFNLNPDQATKTVDTAKKTVTDGLLKEVTSGNVSGLLEIFNAKAPGATNNPIVGGIVQQLVTNLVQKVGLNQQMATTVSNFVVPFIVSKLAGSKEGGFSTTDLTSMLGGGVADKIGSALGGKEGLGGAIGGLGKMFGK
jgi:hypothetical protein